MWSSWLKEKEKRKKGRNVGREEREGGRKLESISKYQILIEINIP